MAERPDPVAERPDPAARPPRRQVRSPAPVSARAAARGLVGVDAARAPMRVPGAPREVGGRRAGARAERVADVREGGRAARRQRGAREGIAGSAQGVGMLDRARGERGFPPRAEAMRGQDGRAETDHLVAGAAPAGIQRRGEGPRPRRAEIAAVGGLVVQVRRLFGQRAGCALQAADRGLVRERHARGHRLARDHPRDARVGDQPGEDVVGLLLKPQPLEGFFDASTEIRMFVAEVAGTGAGSMLPDRYDPFAIILVNFYGGARYANIAFPQSVVSIDHPPPHSMRFSDENISRIVDLYQKPHVRQYLLSLRNIVDFLW